MCLKEKGVPDPQQEQITQLIPSYCLAPLLPALPGFPLLPVASLLCPLPPSLLSCSATTCPPSRVVALSLLLVPELPDPVNQEDSGAERRRPARARRLRLSRGQGREKAAEEGLNFWSVLSLLSRGPRRGTPL